MIFFLAPAGSKKTTSVCAFYQTFFPPLCITSCVCGCVLSRRSHVGLLATPRTVARQTSLSVGFPRQEHWSGLPRPSPWTTS